MNNFEQDEQATITLDEKLLRDHFTMLAQKSALLPKQSRPTGGGESAYLAWHQVSTFLNVESPGWELAIVREELIFTDEAKTKGYAKAVIALTIRGVTREGVGISQFGGGNSFTTLSAVKAAPSNGLVRAAALFNIGVDIKEDAMEKAQRKLHGSRSNNSYNNNSGGGYNNQNNAQRPPVNNQAQRPPTAPAAGATAAAARPPAGSAPSSSPPLSSAAKAVVGASVGNIKLAPVPGSADNGAPAPAAATSINVPKLRVDIRNLFKELQMDENDGSVKTGIKAVTGEDLLDRCTDEAKLEALKTRLETKRAVTATAAAATASTDTKNVKEAVVA